MLFCEIILPQMVFAAKKWADKMIGAYKQNSLQRTQRSKKVKRRNKKLILYEITEREREATFSQPFYIQIFSQCPLWLIFYNTVFF